MAPIYDIRRLCLSFAVEYRLDLSLVATCHASCGGRRQGERKRGGRRFVLPSATRTAACSDRIESAPGPNFEGSNFSVYGTLCDHNYNCTKVLRCCAPASPSSGRPRRGGDTWPSRPRGPAASKAARRACCTALRPMRPWWENLTSPILAYFVHQLRHPPTLPRPA